MIVNFIILLVTISGSLAQFHLLGQGQYNKIEEPPIDEEGDDGAGSDLVCPDGEFVIGYKRDGPGMMKVICGKPIVPLVNSECETRELSLTCDLEIPDGCNEPDTYMKGLEVIKTGTGADVIFPICCTADNFKLGVPQTCERHFVNARLRPGEHTAAEGYVVTKFTCHNVVQFLRDAAGKQIVDQVFFTHDCPYIVETLTLEYDDDEKAAQLFGKKRRNFYWRGKFNFN